MEEKFRGGNSVSECITSYCDVLRAGLDLPHISSYQIRYVGHGAISVMPPQLRCGKEMQVLLRLLRHRWIPGAVKTTTVKYQSVQMYCERISIHRSVCPSIHSSIIVIQYRVTVHLKIVIKYCSYENEVVLIQQVSS